MRIPGTLSLIFLAYLLVLLPWLAYRSNRHLKHVNLGGEPPGGSLPNSAASGSTRLTREAIWKGTLFMLGCLLALSWITAQSFDYPLFQFPEFRLIDIGWSVACLAGLLGVRWLVRFFRKPEERQKLFVFQMSARSTREWILKSLTVLLASVSEEVAYRGVGPAIIDYMTHGKIWVGWMLCSLAFAAAHWVQGWKSMLVILVIALAMHALVFVTDTLIWAMLVHAVYDFIAFYLISREARKYFSKPVSM